MSNKEKLNIIFLCSSNKDRSPALEQYFTENYPHHEYKSAGMNRYFTQKKGTQYLTNELIYWANMVVFAEDIHLSVFCRDFDFKAIPRNIPGIHGFVESNFASHPPSDSRMLKSYCILNCGHYSPDAMDTYITKAEPIIIAAIEDYQK